MKNSAINASLLEGIAERNAQLSDQERGHLMDIASALRGAPDTQAHSIDVAQAVRFYDDRGKADESLGLTEVLFVKGAMVLCEARFPGDDALHTVLFDRDSREVLTENFQFWYAENP